jgi:hypothetical protein
MSGFEAQLRLRGQRAMQAMLEPICTEVAILKLLGYRNILAKI